MTDNVATLNGYTREAWATSADGAMEIPILLKPGTDLDGRVRAWNMDEQDWIVLNGWNWSIELKDN